MAEASSDRLSPQQLIASHRKAYFLMQVAFIAVGATTMTIAAQFFPLSQAVAMAATILGFDLLRSLLVIGLSREDDLTSGAPSNRTLISYFWSSTPRRWLEYALLALPANAAVTFVLLGDSAHEVQNLGTYTLGVLNDVIGLVSNQVTDLKAGLASLVVDFGIVGLLEYIAARWLFSKRKLIFKEKA